MDERGKTSKDIFIVHGRDKSMLNTVKQEITDIGLNPIILKEQISGGKTIIEKFEAISTTCDFAVILMSNKDDVGYVMGHPEQARPRARQNVILEMGYFVGKLGRKNHICILTRPDVEQPSDVMGLVYITYGRNTNWRKELEKELEDAGYRFKPTQRVDKFENNEYITVNSDYDKTNELNPKNIIPNNGRDNMKIHLGNKEGAVMDYDKAIELNPYYDSINAILEQQKEIDKIIEDIKKNTERVKAAMRAKAIELLSQSNKETNPSISIKLIDKAIILDPDNAPAYSNRGIAKFNLGDKEGAIKDYDRAIELYPRFVGTYYNRGIAKFDLGDKEGAINDYDKAIELGPNFSPAYIKRGIVKYILRNYEEALKDFNRAIELHPYNSADAYNYRGATRYILGDKAGAIKDYDKAIELDPNYTDAYNNRGIAKCDLGDNEGAIKDYDKAIELNPNYFQTYNNKAWCLCCMKEYETALINVNKSLDLEKTDTALGTRGVILTGLSRFDEALADFNKAIELAPNDAGYYEHRASLYRKMTDVNGDVTTKEDLIKKAEADETKVKGLKQ